MTEPRRRIEAHFRENLARVDSILAIHGIPGDRDVDATHHPRDWPDLLRFAVVLLHATLEDLLRSLAEWKLPLASPRALERISFGLEIRKERITLAELAEFRGRSVDWVVADSVAKHLENATYNNVGDVVRFLASIELTAPMTGRVRLDLAGMMTRRHLIAHRADRGQTNVAGDRPLVAIAAETVAEWAKSVELLGETILEQT